MGRGSGCARMRTWSVLGCSPALPDQTAAVAIGKAEATVPRGLGVLFALMPPPSFGRPRAGGSPAAGCAPASGPWSWRVARLPLRGSPVASPWGPPHSGLRRICSSSHALLPYCAATSLDRRTPQKLGHAAGEHSIQRRTAGALGATGLRNFPQFGPTDGWSWPFRSMYILDTPTLSPTRWLTRTSISLHTTGRMSSNRPLEVRCCWRCAAWWPLCCALARVGAFLADSERNRSMLARS